ncbi:hypothetical protein PISMIDRAFT_12320 [Pisolithus microcarpus 441]|uniref:Uncharacterized protein n=1 Tax=Pisolithus microcarpus 441 TaxID=765257 RepID=A0A0C9Y9M8_9AGAM|nr:hypothetical protein PISMIDRAFT_12320 [Pisolithus microcarpus 441]
MDSGRLPSYKFSYVFRFHPYARVKPSARERVMAALYTPDDGTLLPAYQAIPSDVDTFSQMLNETSNDSTSRWTTTEAKRI